MIHPSFDESRIAIALKREGGEDGPVAPPGDHADPIRAMPLLQVIEALGTVAPPLGVGSGVIQTRFVDVHHICGGIGLKRL